jgi:hypothetical protein
VFRQATGTINARHRGFFAEAGDARQVWARRNSGDEPGVFFLDDGGVTAEVRRDCHEGRLVCPMKDCPDPRFIARGGNERRHHFAHRVAHVKHAAAAVWRYEAMTMLADWARRYHGVQVVVDDGARAATVRVSSERTGRQVELQVTYDRLFRVPRDQSPDLSRQLLVGHSRGLLLPRDPCPELPDAWWCATSRLVSDMLSTGWAIAVNPEHRLIGTLLSGYAARRAGLLPRCLMPQTLLCIVCELDSCKLTEHGLVTPASQQLLDQRARELARQGRLATEHPTVAPHARVRPAQRPEPPSPTPPPPEMAEDARRITPGDPLQAEYLRRAEGLGTAQRLALLKEMFLPPSGHQPPD